MQHKEKAISMLIDWRKWGKNKQKKVYCISFQSFSSIFRHLRHWRRCCCGRRGSTSHGRRSPSGEYVNFYGNSCLCWNWEGIKCRQLPGSNGTPTLLQISFLSRLGVSRKPANVAINLLFQKSCLPSQASFSTTSMFHLPFPTNCACVGSSRQR